MFIMMPTKNYRLQKSLGYQLSVASRIQERRLDEGLKNLGLSRITWCVLLAVGNENLLHPSEIADFVGIDRTATSRALRQMESAGMVARRAEETDGRMTKVHLTDLGRQLLHKGTPLALANNEAMHSCLDPAERAELARLLSKIRQGETEPLPRL